MRKDIERIIEIPGGIDAELKGNTLLLKGKGKEIKREFDTHKTSIVINDRKIKISAKKASLRESKNIGTIWAHINNMINGLNNEFIYELEICNIHFPMNVKVQGDKVIIKSYLGEANERIARILPNVKVEVIGNKITVSSHNIEAAGQTAANLEKATKINNRDKRIFQDGIYITSKCGEKI